MKKEEFKRFIGCYLKNLGFTKIKRAYYKRGTDVLCSIDLQKSNYSNSYYVNISYYIGEYETLIQLPTRYEMDVWFRFSILSKTQTYKGEYIITSAIEYEYYTEEEIKRVFDKEFQERVLPPLNIGKTYLLENLKVKYHLAAMNQEDILNKLKS